MQGSKSGHPNLTTDPLVYSDSSEFPPYQPPQIRKQEAGRQGVVGHVVR